MSVYIKLVDTSFYTRYPCTVCGGYTEKVSVLAEGRDADGDTVRVCEQCLEGGKEKIDFHLLNHATDLRRYADYVQSLVGNLDVPTFKEWRMAMMQHEAEWLNGLSPQEREGECCDRHVGYFDGVKSKEAADELF